MTYTKTLTINRPTSDNIKVVSFQTYQDTSLDYVKEDYYIINTSISKMDLYEQYLKEKLSPKYNILNVERHYDYEGNQIVFVLLLDKEKNPEEIPELSLKIHEEAYLYAKDNDLFNSYNDSLLLVKREL